MITWIQTNLQKHFRALFVVILFVTIVAFVFMPAGGPGGESNDLKFYDTDLSTQASRSEFFDGAQLSAYIQLNGMRMPQNSMEQYAFNRATALHLANEHKIPTPTKDQLKDFIQTLPMFQGPNGEFSATKYSLFIDQVESAGGFSKSNISKVLGEEWRIQKVYDALSGPSFVQADEVIELLKSDKTEWSVATAELDLASYEPEIDMSVEKLQEYYDTNSFRYATPIRRIISYAAFNPSNYLDEIEVPAEALQVYFSENESNYTKPNPDTEAEAEEKTLPQTFEEAKEQVTFDYKMEQGKTVAQEKAQDIILSIIDKEAGYNSADFKTILAVSNAELQTTAPFAQTETPIGTSWSPTTASTAFELTETRYYSDPILEGDLALVLFLESEIESEIPDFYSVQDDIGRDYRLEELRRLQVSYGEELQATLSEASTTLDDFKAAATEAGLETKTFEKFTRLQPAEGLSPSIAYSLSSLSVGDVTPMTIQGDNGMLTYVMNKETPEIATEGEEFDTSKQALMANYERYVVSQYISELANEELIRSGIINSNG
ncbi:SurA N-terminal domain-containing protein [Puniceicoccaceae bacterium K14]|nr:SurA N-terminal domain-containing protein [Puniceicoccaceae bacterium K14]